MRCSVTWRATPRATVCAEQTSVPDPRVHGSWVSTDVKVAPDHSSVKVDPGAASGPLLTMCVE